MASPEQSAGACSQRMAWLREIRIAAASKRLELDQAPAEEGVEPAAEAAPASAMQLVVSRMSPAQERLVEAVLARVRSTLNHPITAIVSSIVLQLQRCSLASTT